MLPVHVAWPPRGASDATGQTAAVAVDSTITLSPQFSPPGSPPAVPTQLPECVQQGINERKQDVLASRASGDREHASWWRLVL